MIEESNYSGIDRLTHRIAFSSRAVQLTAADIENTLFSHRFRHIPVERPIFVSSVPRAGTTLLLELLTRTSELGSHTYRDMPFVLAPVLWAALSGRFRVGSDPKKRAHGDGMEIDFDSPEAFEEVLWRAFWPKKFKGTTIPLWSEEESSSDFADSFRAHMQKVLHVRSAAGVRRSRYVSKNNANIARLGYLRRHFPNCCIVVPFRSPIDQATSLLRQHRRFLERHEIDAFSMEYMRDLGHLEFGLLHRPIGFPGIDAIREQFPSQGLDYWIGYWRIAFEYLLDQAEHVTFVSYEELCRGDPSSLASLAEKIALGPDSFSGELTARVRAPKEYQVDTGALDAGNLSRALGVYDRLRVLSVV